MKIRLDIKEIEKRKAIPKISKTKLVLQKDQQN